MLEWIEDNESEYAKGGSVSSKQKSYNRLSYPMKVVKGSDSKYYIEGKGYDYIEGKIGDKQRYHKSFKTKFEAERYIDRYVKYVEKSKKTTKGLGSFFVGDIYMFIGDKNIPQTDGYEIKKFDWFKLDKIGKNYVISNDREFDKETLIKHYKYLGNVNTEKGIDEANAELKKYKKKNPTYAKGGVTDFDSSLAYKGTVVGFKEDGTGRAFKLGDIKIPKNSTPKSIVTLAKSKFKRVWYIEVADKNGKYIYEISDEGKTPTVTTYAKGGMTDVERQSMIDMGYSEEQIKEVEDNPRRGRYEGGGTIDAFNM